VRRPVDGKPDKEEEIASRLAMAHDRDVNGVRKSIPVPGEISLKKTKYMKKMEPMIWKQVIVGLKN
jgi:hypothetical protein